MTAGSSAVKITARTALKNKWLSAVISGVIILFTSVVCLNIAGLFEFFAGAFVANILLILLAAFVIFPVSLGVLRFFWRLIFGADDNPVSAFYYFSELKNYIRALKLAVFLLFKLLVYGIIIFFPCFILRALSGTYVYDMFDLPVPLWTSNLSYVAVFFRATGIVLMIFVILRYYIAPVLAVADDDMDISEAIHMSVTISRNTMFDYVYLLFSMLGWVLLSVLVFPLVFTLPYFLTSLMVHVRFAVTQYNKSIGTGNIPDYPTFVAGV